MILIADSTKLWLASFFFSLSAFGPIHPSFSQKRWMMAGHILMLPIIDFVSCYAHFGIVTNIISVTGPECAYYRPGMCIIGSKVYYEQHQYVSGHVQTHLGREIGQPGKKEPFPRNKDPLLT
jgi:hypothetical protein